MGCLGCTLSEPYKLGASGCSAREGSVDGSVARDKRSPLSLQNLISSHSV